MPQKNYTPIDDLVREYKKNLSLTKGKPKEAEPFVKKKEHYHIKEVVEHRTEVDEEVKPFIRVKSETIDLPDDLKNMGLHAATTTEFPNYQNIKLPMSDEKIVENLHQPITSSVRWFATLMEYLLKQAHLILKVINGKVVRVIKT